MFLFISLLFTCGRLTLVGSQLQIPLFCFILIKPLLCVLSIEQLGFFSENYLACRTLRLFQETHPWAHI